MGCKPTPNIFFCGDPHGQFSTVRQAVAEFKPAAIVLLGDCDLERPLEDELGEVVKQTAVYWIHGNHDTDRDHWHDHLFHSKLSQGWLHGRVADISGTRIAGLGGVFRESIWHPSDRIKVPSRRAWMQQTDPAKHWRGGVCRRHRSSIFWEDYETLAGDSADILVSHEAPSCHQYGFSEIDDLAEFLSASMMVHGHHHEDYRTTTSNTTQVVGVGKGSIFSLVDGFLVAGGSDC